VHYNLLSVGTSNEEIAHAANVVREMGGGMAVVRRGEVVARWELPIVGIFSRQPLHEARDAFVAINEAIRSLGCDFRAPILALSFVALSTIPAYGLTDLGLIDVATQQFVDVVVATS
jgi:adenine deaminase